MLKKKILKSVEALRNLPLDSFYLISAKSHILLVRPRRFFVLIATSDFDLSENDRGPIFLPALAIISWPQRLPQAVRKAQLLATAPQGLGLISVIIASSVIETLTPLFLLLFLILMCQTLRCCSVTSISQLCHRTIHMSTTPIFTEYTYILISKETVAMTPSLF